MVITASNGLEQCDTITLGFGTKAQIISINTHLAVLSPVDKIAPRAIATFQLNPQESPMHVTSGGFSYGGSLGAPTITHGIMREMKNLRANDKVARLEIDALPGDYGGPIYDNGGAVIGILLPKTTDTNRLLPDKVHFAATWDLMKPLLLKTDMELSLTQTESNIDPIDLSNIADDTVAVIKCW